MSGLTDLAAGESDPLRASIQAAHEAWQESMMRRLTTLRASLGARNMAHLASLVGAQIQVENLELVYWGQRVRVTWPGMRVASVQEDQPLSTFDTAMILYHLDAADGTPLADRWIGFRELPDGGFYHQAFQGYSGDPLARRFADHLDDFDRAARALGGMRLTALAPAAYAFLPLPRIRMAAAIWPGDEDFESRASVLFDAASSHYMTTDGLALLGSGLARRLLRAASE